jgi:D-glycero-D-manno-heptose 1,7-bisphosphate phosphatase
MLIILDRDGVINQDSDAYIKSPNEWHPIPGSLEAIAQMNHAHVKVVVVTNQSGVGRGLFSEQVLAEIHAKMRRALEKVGGHLDNIYICPHRPDEHCNCRKPKTGLLDKVKTMYPSDFKEAIFIGDTLKDVQAAESAGCRAALVKTGKGERTLRQYPELKEKIPIYADLKEAVSIILQKEKI